MKSLLIFSALLGSLASEAVTQESTVRLFDYVPSTEELYSIIIEETSRTEAISSGVTGRRLDVPYAGGATQTRRSNLGTSAVVAPTRRDPDIRSHVLNGSTPVSTADDGYWGWMSTRVQFALNSSNVQQTQSGFVDAIGKLLASKPDIAMTISGHADASGSDSVNIPLSKRRAQAVKEYLLARYGIAPGRLDIRWRGSFEPVPGLSPFDPTNRQVRFGVRRADAPEFRADQATRPESHGAQQTPTLESLINELRTAQGVVYPLGDGKALIPNISISQRPYGATSEEKDVSATSDLLELLRQAGSADTSNN